MAKKASNKKNDLEKLSFEQAIETLGEIVDKIETGQVSLADSLAQYEKGVALIKHCRGILLDAEKRIEEITDGEDELSEPAGGEESEEEQDESEDDEALF